MVDTKKTNSRSVKYIEFLWILMYNAHHFKEPLEFSRGDGMKLVKAFCIIFTVISAAFVITGTVNADPCLTVYPSCKCTYHYDINEYYTVGPGHPLYDPEYDRGGEVLLDINDDKIDESVYQAPELIGFEPSVDGNEGYVFGGLEYTLIVDGFNNEPITYENILIVFDQPNPPDCTPDIIIDGIPLEGTVYEAGDLVVSTPTQSGNNYSDTMTFEISWRGCYGVHIWAFADENYNGQRDGGECFTAFSHDSTIPIRGSSWSEVKSISK